MVVVLVMMGAHARCCSSEGHGVLNGGQNHINLEKSNTRNERHDLLLCSSHVNRCREGVYVKCEPGIGVH